MQKTRPLEVVFLTNYTDFCYRSIPAVAQMADDFAIRLTILHTMGEQPSACSEEQDRVRLNSFFPEADHYLGRQRMLMRGTPLRAVQRLSTMQPVDLLIAPASDPLGVPRMGHRSLRAQLMRECGVPVWTIGRRTETAKLRVAPRNIACWIDFDNQRLDHVSYALEYASKLGTQLHLLHALPEIHEGTLALRDRPLSKEGAAREMRKRIGWPPVPVQFHVAKSDGRRERAELMERCCADVVFVADEQPMWNSWLTPKPKLMDECICPVICIPAGGAPVWRLEPGRGTTLSGAENGFPLHPEATQPLSRRILA